MKFGTIARFVSFGRCAKILTALILTLFTITSTANAAALCETIIQNAYKQLGDLCNTIERNQACYGNDAIRTEVNLPFESAMFSKVGDKAPLTAIREIYTLPMDISTATWGLSMMKVQTDLPDTAPGQNVIFILYGDTHLTNADDTGKMSAFYFTSGLGQPACKSAPSDGITVRSPKGMRVQFSANGVNIDIGSTVVLKATANKEMRVQLVEGSAKITADSTTMNLQPGETTSIRLGGIDGLQAISPPSAPFVDPETQAHRNLRNIVLSLITVNPAPAQPTQPPPIRTKPPKPTKSPTPKPSKTPKPTKPPTPKPSKTPKPTKPP